MGQPTIKDIAVRAGVSRSTVSRVLSGHSKVSPDKQAVVLKVVKDMSYRPSPIARSLATGYSSTIHVIVADIRNPVYSQVIRGAEDKAREKGITVVVGNTDDIEEREIEYLRIAKEHKVMGIILVSTMAGKQLKQTLQTVERPLVLVNRTIPGFVADTVTVDNELGAYQATRHLIDLGHKRIFHLAGIELSSASQGRLRGFLRAMSEAGLSVPKEAIVHGDLRLESGEAIGNRLIQEGLKYTAVFAANDLMAIGLMAAFLENNLKIPEDISIIGFDDMDLSRLRPIQLSTVSQPQYEMGKTAVRFLCDRIEEPETEYRNMVFNTRLVLRKTCSPLNT